MYTIPKHTVITILVVITVPLTHSLTAPEVDKTGELGQNWRFFTEIFQYILRLFIFAEN